MFNISIFNSEWTKNVRQAKFVVWFFPCVAITTVSDVSGLKRQQQRERPLTESIIIFYFEFVFISQFRYFFFSAIVSRFSGYFQSIATTILIRLIPNPISLADTYLYKFGIRLCNACDIRRLIFLYLNQPFDGRRKEKTRMCYLHMQYKCFVSCGINT